MKHGEGDPEKEIIDAVMRGDPGAFHNDGRSFNIVEIQKSPDAAIAAIGHFLLKETDFELDAPGGQEYYAEAVRELKRGYVETARTLLEELWEVYRERGEVDSTDEKLLEEERRHIAYWKKRAEKIRILLSALNKHFGRALL